MALNIEGTNPNMPFHFVLQAELECEGDGYRGGARLRFVKAVLGFMQAREVLTSVYCKASMEG
jgi:hypothetical protein